LRKKEAVAAASTPFDPFTSQSELAELAAEWPMSRLVEIWNSIPGITAVTKFTNRKVATERIWKAIQNLGVTPKPEAAATEPAIVEASVCAEPEPKTEAAEPTEVQREVVVEEAPTGAQPEPAIAEAKPNKEVAIGAQLAAEPPAVVAEPEATPVESIADVSAQAPAEVAPVAAPPTPKSTRRKKAAAQPKPVATREGSKTAQVVAMLQREGGATLTEIMAKMGWQKHTVRGFMAGAMKKAGHTVESFSPRVGSAAIASTSSIAPLLTHARLLPRRAFCV
jgi:hypothetical protein